MMLARREVLSGLAAAPMAVPLATASLAAILADPGLASAAAAKLQNVELTLKNGSKVSASLAMPAKSPAAAILLVHEWWGLNDQIKAVAGEYAREGYMALAIDLYGGKVAISSGDARSYMQSVNGQVAMETVGTWGKWLTGHKSANGKLGTVGWCFGGGWSLNASLAHAADATVVYYGNVSRKVEQLKALKGPVLGHYATQDKWINKKMVDGFESNMKAVGKTVTSHWYDAKHAFANPTSARYDEADAKLAWQRTLAFFAKNLG